MDVRDVLADHSKQDELHTTEKCNDDRERGESGDGIEPDKSRDECCRAEEKRCTGDEEAKLERKP